MRLRELWIGVVAAAALLGGVGLRAQTATTPTPLEGTHWKLTWIPGAKIESATPRQAPYIVLDAGNHRMNGSGGCNRLMGGYELAGQRLKFAGAGRTMMACASGMATEDALVKALDATRGWNINGNRLSLRDGEGHTVAAFVAAPE